MVPNLPVLRGSLFLLLLSACQKVLPLAVTVEPNTVMVVAASVSVVPPPHATSVTVDYGDTDSYGSSTPHFPVTGNPTTVPVVGLTAGATSHLRASAYDFKTLIARSGDLTFTAGPLPASFPKFNMVNAAGHMSGYLMVSIADTSAEPGYGIIVDPTGKPVWYREIRNPGDLGFDFQQQSNGHFTLFQGDIGAYEELDIAGNVLHTWSLPDATLGTDGHDIEILPNGHALLTGRTPRIADTTSLPNLLPDTPQVPPDCASDAGTVQDALVEEIDESATVYFKWSSNLEVSVSEITNLTGQNFPNCQIDLVHVDSLTQMQDGSILIGAYYTGNLIDIDRTTASIAWRFGGVKTNFPNITGDPLNGFDHPHFARELSDGGIILMDDGWTHGSGESRAVSYSLDQSGGMATETWEWDPITYSGSPWWIVAGGSAVRESNGKTVMSWSIQRVVNEVDANGTVQWEMQEQPWQSMYRALPIPTLYPPM